MKKLFLFSVNICFCFTLLIQSVTAQKALQFDGINDYATFGTASPSLNTSAFTLEAWIRIQGTGITTTTSGAGGGGLEGTNAVVPLVTKGRGEGETPANININYFMGLVGNKLAADFEEGTGPNHAIIGTTVIPLNTWTHVAATYEPVSAVWYLYINGVQEATLDLGSNITPANTSIQHAGIGTALTSTGVAAGFFNGSIDEVRIWDIARAASEIFNSKNTEISTATNLIGRWGLNEGAGTSASNSVPGSPNGTLTNGPLWVNGAPALNTPPNAPTSLVATPASYYAVSLSWVDNSTNESGFEVERSTTGTGGPFVLIKTTTSNVNTYVDGSVNPLSEYCYRVRAINSAGNSGYTSVMCATTGAEPAGALNLGTAGAYVSFGAAPSLATQTFTIETWFFKSGAGVSNTTGSGGIIIIPVLSKGAPEAEGSTVDANYILGIQAGTNVLAADFEEGTGSVSPGLNHPITGTTPIVDNTWHHAAATFSNGEFKIYLDGILEGTLPLSPSVFPQGASIQHAALGTMLTSTGTANGRFAGVMDEARIWNFAKTEAQIQAGINAEISVPQTGLLARWGLNEGAGSIVHSNDANTVNGNVINTGYAWVTPGAPFNISFTAPEAPTALTVTAASSSSLQLTWADNSSNETAFEIERSTTGIAGPFSLIATLSANSTAYANTGLYAGANYCYRVRAINGAGNSSFTAVMCATTSAEPAGALNLGTAGAYVSFGAAPSVATQNFTIETWFYKSGAGVSNSTGTGGITIIPVLSKGSPEAEGSTVDANYILGIQAGTNVLAADFEEGTGSVSPGLNHPITGTTAIADNTWHHAAATFSNGVFKIYLDGLPEATLNLSPSVFPQGASIQHAALGTMLTSTGTANGRFSGILDEARIWNFAKTEAQIQAGINTEISVPQAGLLARWGLNEGTGTIVNSVDNNANGNIINTGYTWVTPGAPFNLNFIPPAAPTGLMVAAVSNSALQLTWTDNSNDETAFEIEQSTTGSGGSFILIATVPANSTTYANTGLAAGANYCYKVRAINGTIASGYTTIDCASTFIAGPVTLILQDGLNSYAGTRDTYLYDVSPTTVHGAETTFVQDKNVSDDRTSLLKFDLPAVPQGATITSASLEFYVDVEGQGFNMYRMLTPWDESTISFASNSNRHFAANGIDAEAAVNAGWPGNDGYVGSITLPIPPSTIKDWMDGTITNNGWLMLATHPDDGQQLRSRENASASDRPKLTIIYSINPPNAPANPQPTNQGIVFNTNPNVCADVSDPDGGLLSVSFYGRKKIDPNARFTVIGLPDTQFYTEEPQGANSSGGGHNGIFKAQTQWIADHRIDSAIAFVVQLGDCVQNGDNPPGADPQKEWKRADTAIKIIENPNVALVDGIPYGICVGNHDQGTIGNPDLPTNFYNQYFGEARFLGRAYYGGHYSTNNENHYELFSAGGVDFIHISIEYYPNGTTTSLQAVLDWADNLLKTNPGRKGILSSHNLLGTGNPASFNGPGQKIYDELKDNPNFILMLAGHVAGEGRRTDVFNGNTVHTVMADYQSGFTNGGNGFLRIMQFLPGQNLLNIKTYSPFADVSRTGSSSEFSLPVNFTQPFELIGSNLNVPSGSQTCVNWPSLEQGAAYEWYAVVTDANGNSTTGPVWSFTVSQQAGPVVTLQPQAQTICNGDMVSFSSTATGTPAPTVQWQVSTDNGTTWSDVSGAIQPDYSFTTTAADDGHLFRAVWTNSVGSTNSEAAVLTVKVINIGTSSFTRATCPNDNNGSITLVATGGMAPYFFSIDGGANYFSSGSFINLAGINYNIRIKDAQDCKKDTVVSLTPLVSHWNGSVDTDWHNPANWSLNAVPNGTIHVVIDAATTFNCILTTDAAAASIRIKDGAQFEISVGINLQVTQNCNPLPPE